MLRKLKVIVLLFILSSSVAADGIDEVFTKSLRQTWGEWFSSLYTQREHIQREFNKSYAIVIGVSQFTEFPNLGTSNDPTDMKDYLINEAGFDYVRLITDDKVNLNKIRSIMITDMPKKLGPKDRFLFYWSGHGDTDPRNGIDFGYLPVTNSRKGDFSTMLDMNALEQWDRGLSAKQTFYLLDACYSGTAGVGKMNPGQAQTVKQIARPSRQILTAGLADEETIVINRLGGSVFTRAVLDGLRGFADTSYPNLPKDGIITARELEIYVKRRVGDEVVKSQWNKSITPLLTRLTYKPGDFFFMSEKTIASAPSGHTRLAQANAYSRVTSMSASQKPRVVLQKPRALPKRPRGQLYNGTFIDRGDGTIADTRNNLIWQKCSQGQDPYNCSETANLFSWRDAQAYSNRVSGWRMPTIDELKTLNVMGKNPTINRSIFPNTHKFSISWSATAANEYDAWAFDFGYGKPISINKDNSKELRLVK